MAKRQKTKVERDRAARWDQIVSAYQRRHRQWVMTFMPSMDAADWETYTRWVAGFGALSHNQAYRNSRKMRRRLTAAKNVTVTVRTGVPPTKPFWAPRFVQPARAAGKTAKVEARATRQLLGRPPKWLTRTRF